MIKRAFTLLAVFHLIMNYAAADDRIFRWVSEDGSMIMNGGKIEQRNYTATNYINVVCGEDYVMKLVGKKGNINETGTEDSAYLELTLRDGRAFHANDIIRITAFRYKSDSENASIAFIFNNGAEMTDNNVWPETCSKAGDEPGESKNDGSNEAFSFGQSFASAATYDFVVPAAAEGATSLRLTRDKAEAYLYISEMEVFSDYTKEATGINTVSDTKGTNIFTLQGSHIGNHNIQKGRTYIVNGKKVKLL